MAQRVYVTMPDGNTAGSIVMQSGEREDLNHRTTNGATYEEVLDALHAAGYGPLAEPVTEVGNVEVVIEAAPAEAPAEAPEPEPEPEEPEEAPEDDGEETE